VLVKHITDVTEEPWRGEAAQQWVVIFVHHVSRQDKRTLLRVRNMGHEGPLLFKAVVSQANGQSKLGTPNIVVSPQSFLLTVVPRGTSATYSETLSKAPWRPFMASTPSSLFWRSDITEFKNSV
jgi:hypothetical protein